MLPDEEKQLRWQAVAESFGVDGHVFVFKDIEGMEGVAILEQGRMQTPNLFKRNPAVFYDHILKNHTTPIKTSTVLGGPYRTPLRVERDAGVSGYFRWECDTIGRSRIGFGGIRIDIQLSATIIGCGRGKNDVAAFQLP